MKRKSFTRSMNSEQAYYDPEKNKCYDIRNTPKDIRVSCMLLSWEKFRDRYSTQYCAQVYEQLTGEATVNPKVKAMLWHRLYSQRQMFTKEEKPIEQKPLDKKKAGRPKRMHTIMYEILVDKETKFPYSFPPQEKQILKALMQLGKGFVNELQLASHMRECGLIVTKQDPWKIFRNYQGHLRVLKYINYDYKG